MFSPFFLFLIFSIFFFNFSLLCWVVLLGFLLLVVLRSSSPFALGGAAWSLPSFLWGGVAVFPSPVWWCCLPSPPLGGAAFFRTQNTLPGACHSTLFLVSTHCAPRGSRQSCVRVIHSHPARAFASLPLMSMLQMSFVRFPQLLSSSSASPSQSSTTTPACTRNQRTTTEAHSAMKEEIDRFARSPARTGYEPNLADFSNYANLEHNPIDTPDNNPDFRCPDDVTMIDFRQCRRHAKFRSVKQQPQTRSKQGFVFVRSF